MLYLSHSFSIARRVAVCLLVVLAMLAGETPGYAQMNKLPSKQTHKDAKEWARTERELDKAQLSPPPRRNASQHAQCEAKQWRIRKIDELTRKGGSAQQMERLRQERAKARDWQFRAGC